MCISIKEKPCIFNELLLKYEGTHQVTFKHHQMFENMGSKLKNSQLLFTIFFFNFVSIDFPSHLERTRSQCLNDRVSYISKS